MESKKSISKYLGNMEFQNVELLDNALINEGYSNFQIFGIGKPSAKQIERRESRELRKAQEREEFQSGNLLDKLKVAGRKVIRFNPASAAMRGGALAGIRLNIFGIATRLYPAFLTTEQARAKKISVDSIQPAKKAWGKVSNFWIKVGGNTTTLQQAISGAWNKPVFKWTKKAKARVANNGVDGDFNNVTGVEEAASAITVGLPFLTAIVSLIKETKKNPFQTSNPDLENVQLPEQTVTPEELERFAQQTDEDDKILGIPKVAFWIGVGVITLVGGYLVYKKVTAKK
jgi:hypothetical protein